MNKNPFFLLIAEDDFDDRLVMQLVLKEYYPDWQYHFVMDGKDLLDYLHNKPEQAPEVSLLLLDMNMPKKDGIEVLIELRAHPDYQNLPVVGFSTSTSQWMIDKFIEAGGNRYFSKPDNYLSLLEIIGVLPYIKTDKKKPG